MRVLFARFCSLTWHFFRWLEMGLLLLLIGGVGFLLEKATAVLGLRFPQGSMYWPKIWSFSQRLIFFSKKAIVALIIVYVVMILIAKFAKVKIIRSSRLSHHLCEMLMTTVDQIPATDQNKRDKAKNVSAERANKAVRKSFVLVCGPEMIVFIRIPRQIETRKILLGYLDDVADDFSRTTGMKSSAWQNSSNSLTFSSYKVMSFQR